MSKSSSAASLNGLTEPNEGMAALEAGDDEGEEREGAGAEAEAGQGARQGARDTRDAGAALDMPEPLEGPVHIPSAARRRGSSSAASSATGSDGKSRGGSVMWFGGSVSTVEAKETLKRRKVEQVMHTARA